MPVLGASIIYSRHYSHTHIIWYSLPLTQSHSLTLSDLLTSPYKHCPHLTTLAFLFTLFLSFNFFPSLSLFLSFFLYLFFLLWVQRLLMGFSQMLCLSLWNGCGHSNQPPKQVWHRSLVLGTFFFIFLMWVLFVFFFF